MLPPSYQAASVPVVLQRVLHLDGYFDHMKKFRAFIHGKNFVIRDVDRPEPHVRGFYTTVYVEAADFPAAELAAVEVLRKDTELCATTCNVRTSPPTLDVEKIQELDSFDGVRLPREPFVFYHNSDEKPKS